MSASPPTAGSQTATLSQWQLIRLRFLRHRVAVFSLAILAVWYVAAICADFLAPHPRNWQNTNFSYCPPMTPRFSLSQGFHTPAVLPGKDPATLRRTYRIDPDIDLPLGFFVKGHSYRFLGVIPWDRHFFGFDRERYRRMGNDPDQAPPVYFFGSDKYGQDVFSRILFGARVSLSIGLIGIAVGLALGVTIGGISGYVGGRLDNFIQRAIEVINAFPELPLWLAIGAIIPDTWSALQVYFTMTILLSFLNWTGLARTVRSKLLSLREEDYALAARLLGASHKRIIFRHLLPGFTSHLIVGVSKSIPNMILAETALSFLGLGLRPPIVSWGVMLQDCMNPDLVASYPWLLMPVFAIILTVLPFNFFGDGLRDATDPYSSS